MENPAISVIIPLYNAEMYISECLDSLLAQTFQDFEIIVVDDCSTDKSVEIVESYKEKFNERIKISKTEENSGTAGYVPRNIGFSLASGEYVFFADADDYLLDSALETLYKSAKEYDAEVVYVSVRYKFENPDEILTVKDGEGRRLSKEGLEDKTTLIIDSQAENIQKLPLAGNFLEPWSKLVRRDFLIKNKITFPEVIISGDYLWTIDIYCHVKRLLRLPIPVYFYRIHEKSATKAKKQTREEISYRISAFILFLKALNDILNKNAILKENPAYSYKLLSSDFNYRFKLLFEEITDLSSQEIYETLIREFEDKSNSSEISVPFFFSQIVNREKRILKSSDPIVEPKIEDKFIPFDSEIASSNEEQHPAVSVIIPMYNVEKYIGECLESIRLQTLQDFEVIVVDDCSTDSSYKVVESYIPKFDGRLKLAQTEKNSGGETMPRNIGFNMAKGEYILFVDSDDFILLTALENLYKAAKEYNADVVYTCEYYRLDQQNEVYKLLDGSGNMLSKKGLKDTTTLRINKPYENLYQLIFKNEFPNVWTKFVRREFLIKNKILSPLGLPMSGDFIWVIDVFAHAKNLVRMPFPFYFYRHYQENSVVKTKREPAEQISHWIFSFVVWLLALNNLYRKNEILHENPAYCYKALYNHFSWNLRCLSEELKTFSDENIYEILYKKFTREDGSTDLIVPFFFSQIINRERLHSKSLATLGSVDKYLKLTALKALVTKFPAISVIIPMYNREKYIGECLDCLLAQTFPYFEVIVIDDCSTDNSIEVVESYKKKFNERLKLIKLEKNTGHPGEPRNRGIAIAQGEYIYCLDSDDIITETALEEMYSLGKKYDAEVVYCEKYFMSEGIGQELKDNIYVADNRLQNPPFVDNPTLDPEDLAERVKKFLRGNYWMSPALKIVKRDLLIENNIKFPSLVGSEDDVWSMEVLFCSKRFLRIPNICFIRRLHEEGISFGEYTTPDHVQRWMDVTIRNLKEMDNFLKKIDFFKENPHYRYEILARSVRSGFANIFARCANESSFNIYNIFHEKFGSSMGDHDVLISSLCTYVVYHHKELLNRQERTIQESEQHIAKQKTEIAKQEAEINQLKTKVNSMSSILALRSAAPAVSVIIPTYNMEKYITECLYNLLPQTFQDFEVIVVDDCSTDGSMTIVKNYIPKFNGRLKFASTQKNTGNHGEPINIGISLSRGEYLLILDNNDAITPDALEKLYRTAKDYEADVVSCEKYYLSSKQSWNDVNLRQQIKPQSYQKGVFVSKPTLIPSDISKRIQECYDGKFLWSLWSKLIRRDFLIENKIRFACTVAQDILATFGLVYAAKNFVRVPYVINFYRETKTFLSKQEGEPVEQLQKYLNALKFGIRELDSFLSGREFFQKNPAKKYVALNIYVQEMWKLYIQKVYDKVPAQSRNEILQEEFAVDENKDLLALIFNGVALLAKNHGNNESINDNFLPYLTARVDIRLIPKTTASDFQIFSLSDDKATAIKPLWLNRNGIGYMITSIEGKIDIVAKATADGRFDLNLRGLDIRDPENDSKRIPYWIDYTKLIINYKTIFDTFTPAWHDESYRYEMNVKANDEIRIQIEWLPHRYDILPEVNKTTGKLVDDKFMPYLTSRVDIELAPETSKADFKILSVSDDRADVTKPAWLQKNGIGYRIQSYAGKMEFVAKATADGQATLKLKGMDIRDPDNKSKLVPYWIDYTKLTVNGEDIIDEITPAWHNKPYRYDINVKADEELKVEVEWFPHRVEILPPPPKPVEKPVAVEFLPNLTARLDVQMVSDTGEGDFQILSVSDKRASVNKPGWLQKDGVGYVIQSYVGKMEFVAKATADGQVTLKLKSMDIHDPEDKSKLVPYWIDYTKLTINGETIIDKLTPAWHDKPYRYDIDVKADEEIKVEVEWFPHRVDILPPPPKPVEKPAPVEFLPNLTARLDVQMVSDTGEGDFQILSVSDKRASVNKPGWLQKDGIGYVIQSYVGKMEFVAKATADGQVTLKLKGMDIHDPEDKSKLVPYWIDYTKLTINGETIIDKLTPAWHDKPYRYDIDVKADEEIKVEVEWFPHRVDILPPPPKPVEKPVVEFLPNLTARLDVQMVSDTGEGDFQILSVSDKRASVNKPGWLQKDGIGYVIQSYVGKMEFVAKATADGQVTLKLKGMDIHDPEDKSKLVPYWIDYTKLTVNGETIIDKLTPAWHDKPYRYDIDVKAGEELKVQVEWFPHREEILVEVIKPVEKPKPEEKPTPVEFLPNLTARLDLQMMSDTGAGDFQILSVSDKRAKTTKPDYLNRKGIGYVVQSCAGKMELVAKANEDGQVILKLKGMDIRDPEDKSKRVPYWIDYTKLTIDGETIFDELTPAWHDKPYRYDIYAEADEEIKIQVEWLTHNKDT